MLTIDLLRHGELVGGVKYRGIIDDPLTELGSSSMNSVWNDICDSVELIYSSPLQRCAIPASQWAKETNIPLYLDSRIQELHYGEWEGLTPEEIKQMHSELLRQWRLNPDGLQPPSGEPMNDFMSRIQTFYSELHANHKDAHVLIVSHSGVLRALLSLALSAPVQTTRHLSIPYACWSRIQIDESGTASLLYHAAGITPR